VGCWLLKQLLLPWLPHAAKRPLLQLQQSWLLQLQQSWLLQLWQQTTALVH
jgi:hypothetical protein